MFRKKSSTNWLYFQRNPSNDNDAYIHDALAGNAGKKNCPECNSNFILTLVCRAFFSVHHTENSKISDQIGAYKVLNTKFFSDIMRDRPVHAVCALLC